MSIKYKKPKITCDECLFEVEFEPEDLYGNIDPFGEYEMFFRCPACGNEIEIFNVEDYGIWPEELLNEVECGIED